MTRRQTWVLLVVLGACARWAPPEAHAEVPTVIDPSRKSYPKPDDATLRKRLTPLQYEVTQRAATEPPFVSLVVPCYQEVRHIAACLACAERGAVGETDTDREPVELDMDFDKHSPVGANVPTGYRRRTSGSWEKVFRPEDLEPGETTDAQHVGLRASIDVIEPLGNEKLLHLVAGDRKSTRLNSSHRT